MSGTNLVDQILKEEIAFSSTQDAVIEWNRVRHLKEPLFSRATIWLWNKMAGSISDQYDRTWFEVLLEILDHLPAHKRNRSAFDTIDELFLKRVEKWPGVWSKAIVLKAEALLEFGPKTQISDLLKSLYLRPYAFTEAAIYLRAYYCYLFVDGRILDVKQARLFYRLVWKCGQNRTVTVASGQQVSILRYLCTIYRISPFQKMLKVAGDMTGGWIREIFRGLEHDLFLQGRNINHKKWYAAKRLERKGIQSLLAYDGSLNKKSTPHQILVTRVQGGLGDILMMNYALQELRRKNPSSTIVFAVPRSYLPWVVFFEGIVSRDIHDPALCLSDYALWYNLSDCPGSHEESGSGRDQVSRVEAWCKALDVPYRSAIASPPKFRPGADAAQWAKSFLSSKGGKPDRKIIALQWASADAYKDYPHMRDLALQLAKTHHVLIFHSLPLPAADQAALESASVQLLIGLAPHQVLALLCETDLVCGPDSSFLHIAGQIEKPSILLAGPINGKLQTASYPKADFIDLRQQLNCVPCWRNEAVHCLASGDFTSLCLKSIEVGSIATTIQQKLNGAHLN